MHEFRQEGANTVMTDRLEWVPPLGWLGRLADRFFLERHMERFVTQKQQALKRIAEARHAAFERR